MTPRSAVSCGAAYRTSNRSPQQSALPLFKNIPWAFCIPPMGCIKPPSAAKLWTCEGTPPRTTTERESIHIMENRSENRSTNCKNQTSNRTSARPPTAQPTSTSTPTSTPRVPTMRAPRTPPAAVPQRQKQPLMACPAFAPDGPWARTSDAKSQSPLPSGTVFQCGKQRAFAEVVFIVRGAPNGLLFCRQTRRFFRKS